MEGAVCRKVAETAEKPGKAVGRHRAVGLLPALHAESGRERGRVCILGAVGSLRGSGQDGGILALERCLRIQRGGCRGEVGGNRPCGDVIRRWVAVTQARLGNGLRKWPSM